MERPQQWRHLTGINQHSLIICQAFGLSVKQCRQTSVFLILNFSREENFQKKKVPSFSVSI